jgi:hypothetical protein
MGVFFFAHPLFADEALVYRLFEAKEKLSAIDSDKANSENLRERIAGIAKEILDMEEVCKGLDIDEYLGYLDVIRDMKVISSRQFRYKRPDVVLVLWRIETNLVFIPELIVRFWFYKRESKWLVYRISAH